MPALAEAYGLREQQSTVGGKALQQELVGGRWSHHTHSQEAERGERWCSGHFLIFMHPRTPARGIASHSCKSSQLSLTFLKTALRTCSMEPHDGSQYRQIAHLVSPPRSSRSLTTSSWPTLSAQKLPMPFTSWTWRPSRRCHQS